jgi:hypothetical protein
MVVLDPVDLGQFEDRAAIQAAGGGTIEVFDRSWHGEVSGLEQALDAVVMAAQAFLIDQERQAFFEGKWRILGIVLLLAQAIPKSR